MVEKKWIEVGAEREREIDEEKILKNGKDYFSIPHTHTHTHTHTHRHTQAGTHIRMHVTFKWSTFPFLWILFHLISRKVYFILFPKTSMTNIGKNNNLVIWRITDEINLRWTILFWLVCIKNIFVYYLFVGLYRPLYSINHFIYSFKYYVCQHNNYTTPHEFSHQR